MVENQEKIKQIIRIINADIIGTRPLYHALRKIKGVNYTFSNAICSITGLDKEKKVGSLTPEEVKKIEDIVNNPSKHNIPSWLFNRRKDFDTGEDKHIITAELTLKKEFDIKRLKKIKAYRGMRHSFGLPVRGQRTKAHFRHGKAIGVKKKGIVSAAPKKEEKTKKGEKKK